MPPTNPDGPYSPTRGCTYNPNDKRYFDPEALEGELARSFDLCQSCRLCFKFCQSFPTLFRAIDEENAQPDKLPDNTTRQIVDECFGCKLCYVNCPYTPNEGHEFELDFPALMLRARAMRVKAEGLPLRERMLADPDRLGQRGTQLPRLANGCNQNRLFRIAMEKLSGLHRDKLLPPFASTTFSRWLARQQDHDDAADSKRHPVALFPTCFVEYNDPDIGRDAVSVLRHNDCRVNCPQTNCCGMPALDSGDLDLARAKATANVRALVAYADRGEPIVVINPTCSLMLRREYPVLLDSPDDRELADAARRVADATRDLGEFLFEQRKAGHFREDFQSTPGGKIAYHVPCHLKMQNVGFRSRDLLRRIPGVKIVLVNQCSGHDGTWAMKREYFELSLKNGSRAFDEMQAAQADVWTTDCPLAAIQFQQATGVKPLHSIQVLARAYRPDGFAHPCTAPVD